MYSNDKPVIKYREDYKPNDFLIKKTYLDFKLYDDYVLVHAKLEIEQNPLVKNHSSFLILDGEEIELIELKVDQVDLNESEFELKKDRLKIHKVSQKFWLSTVVKIYPNKNTSLEGLYLSNGKFCTQCEAEGFRKITYYLDRPDNMSEFFVSIEADKSAYPSLLSNGNLISTEDIEGNRHIAHWHDPFPKPSYLFALVAGDYDCLNDQFITMSGKQVELKLFVDKGKLEQCRFAMDSLIKSMRWDEENFGREYDLDLYMIVAVGDFNMGAMENKGLNVFNTAYVLAHPKMATDSDFEGVESVIAHEYFHNWTGNRITCRDWFQLSLKEGLTVFRDQKFSEDMQSLSVERINQVKVIRAAQFAEDSGPMAHPIRPDSYIEMNNFYTVTVYNKGAEVIRMMHTLLGKDGFRAGMDCYFERHDGQAVTCEDFIKSMEDANNVDWSQFRNWYSQAGTPNLSVKMEHLSNQNIRLDFSQRCSVPSNQKDKAPFMLPIKFGFINTDGSTIPFRLITEQSKLEAEQNWTDEALFIVRNSQESIEIKFKQDNSKAFNVSNIIPSLLRDFSAPVKLSYDYSQQQLACLFAHDTNAFNRWDAGQILMGKLLLAPTLSIPEADLLVVIDAINKILNDAVLDNALKALAVQIPNLNSLIGETEKVSFDNLGNKYRQLKKYIASSLETNWLSIYNQLNKKTTNDTAADRRLKNTALTYLMLSNENSYSKLAIEQLTNAHNMTDELAALQTITLSNISSKQTQINHFYQKWKNEELVLDKWFSAQVFNDNENVIETIRKLLSHEKFSITNPNKVRALVGAFVSQNTLQFNNATGSGYELLCEMVIKLNQVNPQIGARLAKQFLQWKKFDSKRQAIIKEQLEKILSTKNLSKDIYEIVNKTLIS